MDLRQSIVDTPSLLSATKLICFQTNDRGTKSNSADVQQAASSPTTDDLRGPLSLFARVDF